MSGPADSRLILSSGGGGTPVSSSVGARAGYLTPWNGLSSISAISTNGTPICVTASPAPVALFVEAVETSLTKNRSHDAQKTTWQNVLYSTIGGSGRVNGPRKYATAIDKVPSTATSGGSFMCPRLNRWLSRSSLLWLVAIPLLAHNLEEALFMPRILPLDPERIPSALRPLLPEVTYGQFLLVLLPMTVVPFLIAARGDLHRDGSGGIFLLLGLQAVVLLNVFSHIASALVLGGYVPGLLTALFLNLPFSIYVFRRASRERWISRCALLSLPALALLFHGPVLIGLMALSGWLLRSLVSPAAS